MQSKVKTEIVHAKKCWSLKNSGKVKYIWQLVYNLSGIHARSSFHQIIKLFDSATSTETKSTSILVLCLVLKTIFLMIIIPLTGVQRSEHLTMCTPNELKKHDIRKSKGGDVVVPRLYHAAAYELSDPITHLLNDFMLTSTVPAKWNCTRHPYSKTTVPQSSNLRRISPLPLVENPLEKQC